MPDPSELNIHASKPITPEMEDTPENGKKYEQMIYMIRNLFRSGQKIWQT